MRVLNGASQLLRPLAFSPDGRWLAAGAEYQTKGNREVQVWDLAGGPGPVWSGLPNSPNSLLVFDPAGRHLAVVCHTHARRITLGGWQDGGDPFPIGRAPVAYSADGRAILYSAALGGRGWGVLMLGCERDRWAERWRSEVPAALAPADYTHTNWLLDPTAGRVVCAQHRYGRRTWAEFRFVSLDGETGRPLGEWAGVLSSYHTQGLVGPRGWYVLLRNQALFAVRLDEPKSAPVKRLNTSAKHFTDAAFSPDGRWLATTSNDTLVTLWDTATWQPARQYTWNVGRLRSVAFSPDGTLCAAGSDTGRVVVWDFDG